MATKIKTVAFVLATTLWLTAVGCETKNPPTACTYSVGVAEIEGSSITVDGNSRLDLTATLDTCGDADAALGYQFEWYYDTNGNQVLDGDELEPFGLASEISIVSCFNEIGTHRLELHAVSIVNEGEELEGVYTVEVVKPARLEPAPACVQDAIDLIQNRFDTVLTPEAYTPFTAAAQCLKEYTETNICNFEANYAAVVAMGVDFASKTTTRFIDRNKLVPADLEAMFDDEIVPMLQRLTVVEQKAPADFVFPILSKGEVEIFGDIPYLEGDESSKLLLQGDHDLTDVHAFAFILHQLKGLLDMMFAYDGIPQALLQFPRLDTINFDFARKYFVGLAIDDEDFLTLAGPDGKEGIRRLFSARGEFMEGFLAFRKAIELIQSETDPQADDLLRYWDCGTDGICDCKIPQNNVLICPNNPGDYKAPDDDGTEGNGKYDVGEPVGSERLANPNYYNADLPADLKNLVRQILLLVENIRGPDALDLNDIAEAPVTFIMDGFLLPVPEIRISEWFLSPTAPRDVMPIYSIRERDTLFDIESEPFDDVGYDGLKNVDEVTLAGKNPRAIDGVQVGDGFDPLKNPDPAFDDFDPFCNPYCNWDDGVDNDGDGLVDRDDIFQQDWISVVRDLGVENNLVFDFVDENENLEHDVGEIHEPFDDRGTMDLNGDIVGRGDGVWTRSDRSHPWPSSNDMGPKSYDRSDPANGVTQDQVQRVGFYSENNAGTGIPDGVNYVGLIDNYYFFFQDPTFSGAFTFPDEIQNTHNEALNENGKLMRFINKILELAESFGVRDGNAHPCGLPGGCQ